MVKHMVIASAPLLSISSWLLFAGEHWFRMSHKLRMRLSTHDFTGHRYSIP